MTQSNWSENMPIEILLYIAFFLKKEEKLPFSSDFLLPFSSDFLYIAFSSVGLIRIFFLSPTIFTFSSSHELMWGWGLLTHF